MINTLHNEIRSIIRLCADINWKRYRSFTVLLTHFAVGSSWLPQKTSENVWFPSVFRVIEKNIVMKWVNNNDHMLAGFLFSETALQRCFSKKMLWRYSGTLQENTHGEVWYYWNHTSACAFSCKFAAYFQNTFSWQHT